MLSMASGRENKGPPHYRSSSLPSLYISLSSNRYLLLYTVFQGWLGSHVGWFYTVHTVRKLVFLNSIVDDKDSKLQIIDDRFMISLCYNRR